MKLAIQPRTRIPGSLGGHKLMPIVHAGLFLKLIQRNVPLVFLDLIISWYGALFCCAKE